MFRLSRKPQKLTMGRILSEAFSQHGIKARKEPILTQWTVREYGTAKREIDSLDAFITSLADGSYHIQLEDVSINTPKYQQFGVKLMDIEATLQDGEWSDIKIYTDEEELPSKDCATPTDVTQRMNDVISAIYKTLTFLMLVWQAVKAGMGFFS